ncbi:C2H2 domain-containing protein [Decorospora gaudefroyi]|uniref:C2H2 domain-containing protein n=1 Tax=Decorospora gaudefroyi TaxID=184978 RepID=A0A6A5JX74_9PLEO|nr:C2H2 domain-containing protein [Decorospora gaudefroyi]
MASVLPSQQTSRTSTGTLSQQPTLVGSNTPPLRAPGEAFTRALTKFRARLTGKDLIYFGNATYGQLCGDILRIQKEQESRMEMMNLSRIKSCLETMNEFGRVIEVFLNVSDAVAFVWGPMKFLLLTASTFTDSFEILLDAYERIGEQLPLLSEYDSLFHTSPHMIGALELIYIDILEFHQQAMKFFSGRLWTRFFKSILAEYRRYQEDMADLKARLDEAVKREQAKKNMMVKEWLAVGEQPQIDHDNFCRTRKECATTAHWILQHETIKHWMEADVPNAPVVWMHGIPGAGKTILASAIIDECKRKLDFTTCYFYCHDGDQMTSSAVGILKGLADQLLDQFPQMLPPCYTRRISSGEPSLRSITPAKKILEDFCSTVPKLFIIIDGLDECERVERSQILTILTDIVGQCEMTEPGKLRVLVVSQDYADIRKSLQSSAANKITPKILRIMEKDNEGDIQAFTRMWVDKITLRFSLTKDLTEYLRNLTVANAKGMFLYAKLVLQDLYASFTRAELMDAIRQENFPAGLEGALTWKEIQAALSIDIEHQAIRHEENHMRDHIYDICGSLVLVVGDRISLVHSTAKTYITNITKDIHEPSIECELATLCLQYLTFPCFEVEDPEDAAEVRRMALGGHFAFQDYAIAKWSYHVNAWAASGAKFLGEAIDQSALLEGISEAMDDFMARYSEEDWASNQVDDCKRSCAVFEDYPFYDSLVQLTSHIYTFQQKGFKAQHKISIVSIGKALERNRKVLEDFPKSNHSASEEAAYSKFYDGDRRFKCTRITCRYFSEGFKDEQARKQHVNIHDRPYQCEVPDCLGAEGFTNSKDLEKHIRAFHPEMSDLAQTFNSATATREKAHHACTICGKTFTRNFHRKHHELSHRGERPHECPECGKAFTRLNDLKRHQKLHDRK